MAPSLLFDISALDLSRRIYSPKQIEAVNPQRGDMRQLDGIIHVDAEKGEGMGVKDVADDEFWVPGHIPGRPLLPGVLMIEAAAQLCAFLMKLRRPEVGFVGFLGADAVKFRGQVVPCDTLYILGKEFEFRPRRFICDTQAVVNGAIVFEGRITGMPI